MDKPSDELLRKALLAVLLAGDGLKAAEVSYVAADVGLVAGFSTLLQKRLIDQRTTWGGVRYHISQKGFDLIKGENHEPNS